MKKILLTFCLSLITIGVFAKGDFKVNTNIKTAYAKIIEMRLSAAQTILNKEKKVNPNNLMVIYL